MLLLILLVDGTYLGMWKTDDFKTTIIRQQDDENILFIICSAPLLIIYNVVKKVQKRAIAIRQEDETLAEQPP